MNATFVRTCALAALLAATPVASARAGDAPDAAPAADPQPTTLDLSAPPAMMPPASTPAPSLELLHVIVPDEQLLGVHYRPRRGGWGRHLDAESVSQIHLGFFDPEGAPGSEFLLGIRGGPMLSPNVQLGVGLDWSHIVDNTSSVSQQSTGPNGTTITVQQDLSRASTNLFPIMAFLQVSGDDDMSIIPYFGIAGGYEVMNLSADNYQTNQSFDATYGGWGWQAWAGAALPLSGRVRVTGEAFVNTAEPGRDVTSAVDGLTYRETVKANGAGARIGLAWGF